MSEVTIRRTELRDAPRVAELMSVLGYPSSTEDVLERLTAVGERSDMASWIAEAGGATLGFVGACTAPAFEKNGVYGRILALVVDASAQGMGVGRALVAEAERWMSGQGAADVFVHSGHHRPEAHEFYRRMGYEATGLRFRKVL